MPLKFTSATSVVITSAFDANLEIAFTNQRHALKTNFDIWQWRIRKWHYDVDNQTRYLSKFYTLRDMFLIDDLLAEARARLKSMYKYIFKPSQERYMDLNMFEQQRIAQYMWDMDFAKPEREAEEGEIEENAPRQFPWEGLIVKKAE